MTDISDLPSYHATGIGWEPTEPWWDAGYWAFVREYWRLAAVLPVKRNARRYGR